jgi:hypothetical protein
MSFFNLVLWVSVVDDFSKKVLLISMVDLFFKGLWFLIDDLLDWLAKLIEGRLVGGGGG